MVDEAMALLSDSSKQSLLPTFFYSSSNSFSLDQFHDANNSTFAASHESLDVNNLLNPEFPFSKFNPVEFLLHFLLLNSGGGGGLEVNDGDAKYGYDESINDKILGMEKKK
ncbi:hypothetical protein J1N35_024958 [Gossypium stocksii]|uniref:Uncharacterized protein n=1 Tax=Gossypium stocksii TaxID=47602 RepID=A0A9D3ZVR4_9ROSI|nr:hypothetical protein J1N35_024958 [Gossypium stocksii]